MRCGVRRRVGDGDREGGGVGAALADGGLVVDDADGTAVMDPSGVAVAVGGAEVDGEADAVRVVDAETAAHVAGGAEVAEAPGGKEGEAEGDKDGGGDAGGDVDRDEDPVGLADLDAVPVDEDGTEADGVGVTQGVGRAEG